MFVTYCTGLPAVSVPVGQSENGQPVGLQLIGSWWREDIMLRVATALEKLTDKFEIKT